MNKMVQNLVIQFLKKAIVYGLIPALITFLTIVKDYKPEAGADQVTALVFLGISAGAAGLIGLLKRLLTWDPTKS